MNDLNKDTNKLFSDFFSILERYLIIIWNGIMRLSASLGLMRLFKAYPKSLAFFIILLCFITPPIAIFWIALGLAALNNTSNMNDEFIIEVRDHKEYEEETETEAEIFRNELALKLYEEGIEDSVEAANKVTEAQFGKPINQLIDQNKYKNNSST